jgi:hypothetical protein
MLTAAAVDPLLELRGRAGERVTGALDDRIDRPR